MQEQDATWTKMNEERDKSDDAFRATITELKSSVKHHQAATAALETELADARLGAEQVLQRTRTALESEVSVPSAPGSPSIPLSVL